MASQAELLVLGTRKGTLFFERQGGGWELTHEAHRGVAVPYVAQDPRTGTLWASQDHGHWGTKLERSHDAGHTWEEIPTPKYPEGAEVRPGQPATLKYLWYFAPGGVDEPNCLYWGTEPGGLFKSTDGGASFQLVEGLWNHPSRMTHWMGGGRDEAGVHSILIDPRDSRHIVVGLSVAGVFETTDGGETWQPRNKGLRADYLPNPDVEVGHDPHFLMWCASNPAVLWQQNHFGIFRSTDAALNWEEVSEQPGPARFGFPVMVDPQDPDTAWVVPATSDQERMAVDHALCVCRTTNGGKTWTAYRTGLPQQRCYDVVFRHALDLSGDRLAFGSTTGNLFLSEDRGETWTSLGSHLPPIYSVRFAERMG